MRVRVQLIVERDDEDDAEPPVVFDVGQIERDELAVDTLGLHLAEAKDLVQQVRAILIGRVGSLYRVSRCH